jgi:hypothetical protein
LNDLSDVTITDVATGDVLYYGGSGWVNTPIAGIAASSSITVSTTAPASPSEGDMWFESDTGRTYVYFDSYWVEIGAVSTGSRIAISGGAPVNPVEGDLWFDSDTAKTFVYYDSSWVEVGAANSVPQVLDDLTDVSAASPTNGHFLQWNGTAWVNDEIDLGTDTTGNYVATIAGTTNQVSVSGSGSGSAAVTLSTPQDIHTGATPTFAGATLSGSSSGDLLRITQTGAGNALVVEDSTNPDSTPFVVDNAGRLIVGHTGFVDVDTFTPATQLHHYGAGLGLYRWSANGTGVTTYVAKSRGATAGSYTTLQSGDQLHVLSSYGADGTGFVNAAQIATTVDGAVSTGVVPGRITFNTASSAGTITERMRIDSAGQVGIGGTPSAGDTLRLSKNITGAVNSGGVYVSGAIQSDVTTAVRVFRSTPSTANSNFTLTQISHYSVVEGTYSNITAGGAVTNQYGFLCGPMTQGTNIYGFVGQVAAASDRWNLYMSGGAANYLAGRLGVGATLTSGAMALITNTTAADVGLIVKGAASQTGDLFSVQNSAGTKQWHINSSNAIGHGIGTATTTGFVASAGLVAKTSTAFGPQYVLGNKTNDTSAPYVILEKDRADAVVQSGDVLGNIQFRGYDGANYRPAAAIVAVVDGTPDTDDMPGHLRFNTTADGSSTLTERMRIDSAGQVGIGTTPGAGRNLVIGKAITGSTGSIAVVVNSTIQSDVTAATEIFRSAPSTAAQSFTLTSLSHFYTLGVSTPGSGSAITNQYGFFAGSSLTGATNNYAFYGDVAAASGRWNLFAIGTAANYMAGRLGVGATLTSNAMVRITNTTAADVALIIKGAASQSGYLTEWQNSTGTTVAYVNADGTSSFGGNPLTSSQAAAVLIMDIGA